MRYPAFILLASLTAAACGRGDRDKDAGLLDSWGIVDEGLGRIAVTPNMLYRWSGLTVDQFDVSDPRRITPEATAPTLTACSFIIGGFPCDSLVIKDDRAYVSVLGHAEYTELPDGPPAGDAEVGHVLVSVPEGLATGAPNFSSELLFLSTSLEVVSSLSEPVIDLYSSGPLLYATSPDRELSVFNVTSSSAPAPLGTADIGAVEGWSPVGHAEFMSAGTAIQGDSYLLLRTEDDTEPFDYPCRLEWYRMLSFDEVELVDVVEERIGGCTSVTTIDGYVAVALNSYGSGASDINLHPRIEVYRMDAEEGLVRVFRYRFQKDDELVYDIVADAQQNVLFAGTTGAVYTIDLGIATSGEPAWPE